MPMESDFDVSSRWRGLMRSSGILLDEPASTSGKVRVPQSRCGVSLAYLRAFAAVTKSVINEAKSSNDRTSSVMQRLVLPSISKTRLWDYIPSEHTGPPQLYVVHAWSGSFQDMVDSLVYMAERDEHGNMLSQTRGDLMCWIDMFALNLSYGSSKDVNEAYVSMEETMLVACTEGSVVLVLDRKFAALGRTWCLFELSHALRAFGKTRVQVAIPNGLGVQGMEGLFELFEALDICKSDTSQIQDKIDLLSKVRRGWGLQRCNRELVEGLSQALYCRLRWGGRPEDIGALSILLLKRKGFYLLQAQLTSVFQNPLTSLVEDIFNMYDVDGNGAIDEEELTAGLSAAGFSLAAIIQIFRVIDTDKSGSISYEEFSAYWQSKEGGKVREAMQQQRLDDFSVMGLLGNIDKMSAYLQDHGLQDHSALFENLKGETLIGENMWTQLEPPGIKGNITQIICVVSDYFKTRDYKSANSILYDFLSRNIELLAFHPRRLQRQNDDEGQLFALYMANVIRMVRHHGIKNQLERDYATCSMIMALEGWEGLQIFGGNAYFVNSAKSLMRASDVDSIISHDRISLANNLLNIVDEKRRKAQPGTAALLQQQQLQSQVSKGIKDLPAGALSKLILSTSFPTLSDFRASQHQAPVAGIASPDDLPTSPIKPPQDRVSMSSLISRRLSSDSLQGVVSKAAKTWRRTSIDHPSVLGVGDGLATLLSRRSSVTVDLPPVDRAIPASEGRQSPFRSTPAFNSAGGRMISPKRGTDRAVGQSELSSHQTLKMMTETLSGHAGKAAGGHGRTGHAHERVTESQITSPVAPVRHARATYTGGQPVKAPALEIRKQSPTRPPLGTNGSGSHALNQPPSDWLSSALMKIASKKASEMNSGATIAEEDRAPTRSGPLTVASSISQRSHQQQPFIAHIPLSADQSLLPMNTTTGAAAASKLPLS